MKHPRAVLVIFVAGLVVASTPLVHSAVASWWHGRAVAARIAALADQLAGGRVGAGALACAAPVGVGNVETGATLASWQSIGGCGAGAATGAGGGVKWIGRNVSGGLFNVECQGNYVKVPYGYNYIATTLVTHEVGDSWNLGVSVPYLYKYMNDPYGLAVDVSNAGLGDVNVMLGRKFGAINNWTATLTVGAPTGSHDAKFRNTQVLAQERQLGHGRPTGSLMLDHVHDFDWGLAVLGGTVSWRGGENELQSYRAPSGSAYSYLGYLLGPFTPAAGIAVTGFGGRDRNVGSEQGTPLVSVAANVSLEWATDWSAILLGASMPYDYVGRPQDFGATAGGWGAWVVALGIALAPF